MRLFVALDIPESVRAAVNDLVVPLQKLCPAAKWVRLAGAHVTLKFIGHVPPEQGERIRESLAAVHGAPVDLRFAGLGFFPSPRHPRVFWAGIEGGPPLATLAAAIEDALVPLGIERESRKFHPHLTLARLTSPENTDRLRAGIEKLAAPQFGTAHASEFYLYQSVLKHGGAEYTRLSSYPLSGEPSR